MLVRPIDQMCLQWSFDCVISVDEPPFVAERNELAHPSLQQFHENHARSLHAIQRLSHFDFLTFRTTDLKANVDRQGPLLLRVTHVVRQVAAGGAGRVQIVRDEIILIVTAEANEKRLLNSLAAAGIDRNQKLPA